MSIRHTVVMIASAALQECNFFFGSPRPGKCHAGGNTTLCIIKPHVIMSKQIASILAEISAVFEIKGAELFNVDKRCAAEFFEVYRGVVAASEYSGMVDELTSGPCLVLEIGHRCGDNPFSYVLPLFCVVRPLRCAGVCKFQACFVLLFDPNGWSISKYVTWHAKWVAR
jgi:hypothetical protein